MTGDALHRTYTDISASPSQLKVGRVPVELKLYHALILRTLGNGGTLTPLPDGCWQLAGGGEMSHRVKPTTIAFLLHHGLLIWADAQEATMR